MALQYPAQLALDELVRLADPLVGGRAEELAAAAEAEVDAAAASGGTLVVGARRVALGYVVRLGRRGKGGRGVGGGPGAETSDRWGCGGIGGAGPRRERRRRVKRGLVAVALRRRWCAGVCGLAYWRRRTSVLLA